MTSKHQPNPRKRQIGQVTPEFPSLPARSLSAIVEFAQKSLVALKSVSISPYSTSLFLPLISPHQLQQRFKVRENAVFVVMRNAYSILKNEVDSLELVDYCGIYVRGPVGVGKSYLLYLLAAEYRLDRKNYRVTFINDCTSWRRRPYAYWLEELVMTFYDDYIGEKSIVDWCEAVVGSDKEEKMMMMMMEALINYVMAEKLKWIVICDQHNALYNPSVVKNFPFSIIDDLADNRAANIKVVISASANNEGYPTEMKGWHTHDITSHRFDEIEFKTWCQHYLLEGDEVDLETEEAVDALFWTGGVPYELDLLWKQPKKGLIEKIVLYREVRVDELAKMHGKFCDNYRKKRNSI